MQNPISTLTLAEWVADQVKAIAQTEETIKPTGVYFTTFGFDDVAVYFDRKCGGYSEHHFTAEALAEFYGAVYCTFTMEYEIALVFDSWDKVVEDENGKIYPKKRY